jgi:hypothetical protein
MHDYPLICMDCGESKRMYPLAHNWHDDERVGVICLDCERLRRRRAEILRNCLDNRFDVV